MNRQPHSATIFLLVGCGVVKNPRGFSPGEDVNRPFHQLGVSNLPVRGAYRR